MHNKPSNYNKYPATIVFDLTVHLFLKNERMSRNRLATVAGYCIAILLGCEQWSFLKNPVENRINSGQFENRIVAFDWIINKGFSVKPGFHMICNGRRRSAIMIGHNTNKTL